MTLLIFKIIHFVFLISWFAGLFYLGRMFVYHAETREMEEPQGTIIREQIMIMENRVYTIIMNPAMILTWVSGIGMIVLYGWEWFSLNSWLHYKLIFLIILTIYHLYCKRLIADLEIGEMKMNPMQFRLFNEVPTVLLVLICSLAVLKNNTNPVILLVSIIVIIGLLIFFTKLYKKIRDNRISTH